MQITELTIQTEQGAYPVTLNLERDPDESTVPPELTSALGEAWRRACQFAMSAAQTAMPLVLLIALIAACSSSTGCAGTASQVIKDDSTKVEDCIAPTFAALSTCMAQPANRNMCVFNAAIALISCVAAHPAVQHASPPAAGAGSASHAFMESISPETANCPRLESMTVLPYSPPSNRAATIQFVGMAGAAIPQLE